MRRLLLLLTISCSSPAPAVPPPASQPAPKPASQPAEADECVKECERRNMMRAVSPEMIRADCERECSEN